MSPRRVRSFFWRFLFITVAGCLVGVGIGVATVGFSDLPQVDQLEQYEPKGVTRLLDIHGRTIHEFFEERRIPLAPDQIPSSIKKAFLAAEDWRFYDHFGIDVRGLFRAMAKNVIERRFAEGASTITQQLSRVLFLSPEKTLARKIKEGLLTLQIERRYSKEEILTLYLNQIYLGEGCHGIEAAAETYFQKPVAELSLAQVAMLAGLPKAPNIYSPFKNPEKARHRRDTVLAEMFERGLVSKEDWLRAKEEPLPVKPEAVSRVQSYFAAYVLDQLGQTIGEQEVFRGQLIVQTTLDLDLQAAAEKAVENGIAAYAKRHRIKPEQREKLPQAALLAIDPANGEIRAMVGGRAFLESQFNRAVQAKRQPGSAYKPVLYAAAIAQGYTQSSIFEDVPIRFENRASGVWEPKNYDDDYDGYIPLRVALEKSKNVVAVRLLQAIGLPAFQQMASRLGFESPIAPNLSSALGSSSVTLMELVPAFATFVQGGIRPSVRGIRSVRAEGEIELWPPPPPSLPALDPKVAYIMTDMLSGVVRAGTGTLARDLPCAVAGKTGTTDNNVDSLFVGFSTRLAAGVWVGFDDRKSLGGHETGAVAALPIWKEFMAADCSNAASEFPLPPPGVLLVDVDHSSGKLPGKYCTDVLSEAFVDQTQPTENCEEEGLPPLL